MNKLLISIFVISSIMLSEGLSQYQFISPKPGSKQNSRESTIIIREGSFIDRSSILDKGKIIVTGSKSGRIDGRVIISSDQKTIIFKPDNLLTPDELVVVKIVGGIRTTDGQNLKPYEFSFNVTPFAEQPNPYLYMDELKEMYPTEGMALSKATLDSLPTNFPPMNIEIYDSSAIGEGYIFLAVASEVPGIGYYLMMLNNDGTPFFARELPHDYAYDFKIQPNGQLSYAQFLSHHSYTGGGNVIHMIMDNSFTIVDSVQMGNGYIAEAHDFQILPNGHYLLFGYYLTQVDMSQYVDGGYPAALVSGGVVQELDVNKNVVFQWRSWDYYDFADYPWARRSTGEIVAAFHLNTINLDVDGHIILATPSWNWKLNRQTGDVMWHLGGAMNEFSYIGVDSTDGVTYSTGHTFHRIPNGNFLLYDNGSRTGSKSSMAHEFILDEENKTAELIWSFIPDTSVAGWHRGSAQRLPNGNTVIGWGGSSGKPSPAMTEVNAAGQKVYELSFDPPSIESYRAFRFPFTEGKPSAEVTITEIQAGNSYEFSEGETNDTGINIDVESIRGTGYNELTVQKYNFAPLYPDFLGKAPWVAPRRMILSQYGLTGINADIEFDVSKWNIKNPESTLIFHREFEGSGLFVALPTTYNHVTGIISATTQKFGEFILTQPDLASMIFTPVPDEPADSGTVNQELPVRFTWNPVGYVNYFSLQIARDANFSDMVIDTSYMTDAVYTLHNADTMTTYYWRVKSFNDAGTSEWTATQSFMTVEPYVTVTEPNGGEEWQVGLDYYIRWNDNLAEDVVITLYRGDVLSTVLDTVQSMGAFALLSSSSPG